MEPVGVEAPYREAWIGVYRQFSVGTSLRYVLVASLLGSAVPSGQRVPLHWAALASGLASLAAQILISCPRCHARWPWGSDDDGHRKPCKQCGLRWGQEEDDQQPLEPMDPNEF
jgi:hypothetical protein